MAPAPEISVVIATRGRERLLARTLEALAGQTVATDRFEVVVARDPDQRPPFAPVPAGLEVREVRSERVVPPSARRNLAWRAARAPLVAFTDDDCRPSPRWLDRLLVAAAGDPMAFVQGRTEPDPEQAHMLWGNNRSQEITEPSPWFQTCNMAYSRSLLDRLGGFDEERFGFGGEDTDLGIRAGRLGARLRFAPEAHVRHAVHQLSLADAIRASWRFDSLPRLLARYPEYRAHMFRRYFWKRAHATLLLALAGIALARRHPIALLLAIPYLRDRLGAGASWDPRFLARFAYRVPQRAAVDATETAATALRAAREGVLLL